jgi:hypothetical protein
MTAGGSSAWSHTTTDVAAVTPTPRYRGFQRAAATAGAASCNSLLSFELKVCSGSTAEYLAKKLRRQIPADGNGLAAIGLKPSMNSGSDS